MFASLALILFVTTISAIDPPPPVSVETIPHLELTDLNTEPYYRRPTEFEDKISYIVTRGYNRPAAVLALLKANNDTDLAYDLLTTLTEGADDKPTPCISKDNCFKGDKQSPQLHNATSSNSNNNPRFAELYSQLHQELEQKGFLKSVVKTVGKVLGITSKPKPKGPNPIQRLRKYNADMRDKYTKQFYIEALKYMKDNPYLPKKTIKRRLSIKQLEALRNSPLTRGDLRIRYLPDGINMNQPVPINLNGQPLWITPNENITVTPMGE